VDQASKSHDLPQLLSEAFQVDPKTANDIVEALKDLFADSVKQAISDMSKEGYSSPVVISGSLSMMQCS
jgi:hypothetical protein